MGPAPRYRSTLAESVWPAFSARSAAQKLALLFQMEQSQWRSAAEIAADQFEQLRHLAAFAARTVPHYRKAFGADFHAGNLCRESWQDLPILTRRTLHEAAQDLRSERIPESHGRTFELHTSGSLGLKVTVLGTDLTRIYWQACCLREHFWHSREFHDKLLVIRYQRDPSMKTRAGQAAPGWGPATDDVLLTGPSVQLDIVHDVSFLAETLAAQNPGYLLTHPSMMLGLARHCLERGIAVPGLREARTLGESSSEVLRETCRAAWGVPVVDIYTCQEAGYLALQCPQHEHLHVQSENVLLEVVDAAGRPCEPGQIGRVLVTSLNNYATPLIRYELGDYAEVGDPCPCGRGLPVLKRVMGRYRNLLTLPDGSQRWPLMGFDGKLRDIAPIELMQMVQRSKDKIAVRLVMARPLTASEQDRLAGFIRNNLGYPFRLSFDYVDSIRNPANGKVEQFISLLEPGQAAEPGALA